MKDIAGGAPGSSEAPGTPSQHGARDPVTRLEEARARLARCEKEAARNGAGAAVDELLGALRSEVANLEQLVRRFPRAGKMRRKGRPRCGARRKRDGQPCEASPVWDEEKDRPRNGRCRLHGGTSTGPGPEGRRLQSIRCRQQPRIGCRWVRADDPRWLALQAEKNREPSRETTPTEGTLPDPAIIAEADQTSAA